MLIRRPQTPSWNQPNLLIPETAASPLSPKRWLEEDSGGAVGLGIVAALDKPIIFTSPVKNVVNATPKVITSPTAAACREESEESRRHDRKNERWRDQGYCRSLAKCSNKEIIVPAFSLADLSNCCLCRKRLHGKDVYMYQAKPFCSMECRYEQILSDELKEKSGRSKITSSHCSGHGPLFFTGIVAT